jgi:environmental stress-induced protein Ves
VSLAVVRRADHRVMPWRNGLGTTREIAVRPDPPGARFAWRLSIATVAAPAPFSAFEGYDRTITVIDGAGMVLDVDGVRHRLGRHEPFAFTGEATVSCTPIDGPIHDFNVMTDRAQHRATVEIVTPVAPRRFDVTNATRIVVGLEGRITVARDGAPTIVLDPWDAAILAPGEAMTLAGLDGDTRAAMVTIGRNPT